MMIFSEENISAIVAGTKTQTRRLVKPGEQCLDGGTISKTWIHKVISVAPTDHRMWIAYYPRWQIGRDYAIQPGRGQKAVGRIIITNIRREYLQDITDTDAMSEGIRIHYDTGGWTYTYNNAPIPHYYGRATYAFRALWNTIHTKSGTTWADNPEVWVLEFELMKGKNTS